MDRASEGIRGSESGVVSTLRVCAERCSTCLYRLKYCRQTRARILGDVARLDTFVVCHSVGGSKTVCRGFYDADDEACTVMQLAKRLGLVEFVELPEKARVKEGEEDG